MMGYWREDSWVWTIIRANEVLGAEAFTEFEELIVLLYDIQLVANTADVIIWPVDRMNRFTVKSCYDMLLQDPGAAVLEEGRKVGLNTIWRATVPSKLKIFGWRLMQDRLPTRKQLKRRGIIEQNQDVSCVFCPLQVEDLFHLLLLCPKLHRLSSRIYLWMELDFQISEDCCSHLLVFINSLSGKMPSNRAGAIWLTIYRSIWKVDVGVFPENSVTFGCIFKDHTGEILFSACKKESMNVDLLLAEMLTIRWSLSLAKEFRVERLVV
ncbi:uncharacterized protein LOC131650511 [Vicia villosa]|uniref:uncharacterized protein LOC131650511 n=1 Tax=Vicia villosa TaxID=3911 RepID=UPI00273C1E6A|nr:uncharacterized protein LOC131650511 [Vicia villosa]